jgi:hypothetical protein
MKEKSSTITPHPWQQWNHCSLTSLLDLDSVSHVPEPESLLNILREAGINASLHLTLHQDLQISGAPMLLSCNARILEEQIL